MEEGVHLVDSAQDTQVNSFIAEIDNQATQDRRLDDVLDSDCLSLSKTTSVRKAMTYLCDKKEEIVPGRQYSSSSSLRDDFGEKIPGAGPK